MRWTEKHAEYLERAIRRMLLEEKTTDEDEAKDVFAICRLAMCNLRRPIEPIVKTCPCCGAEFTREQWDALPYVGSLERYAEMRNCTGPEGKGCPARTTLSILK